MLLKNVKLVHAESLAACLQLGPGARLLAEPEDKVTMIKGSDPEMAGSELQVGLQCMLTVSGQYEMTFDLRWSSDLSESHRESSVYTSSLAHDSYQCACKAWIV